MLLRSCPPAPAGAGGSAPGCFSLSPLRPPALPEQKMPLGPFSLRELLPANLGRFFRYNGSLTTPPCFQSVLWTIFEQPAHISASQVLRGRQPRLGGSTMGGTRWSQPSPLPSPFPAGEAAEIGLCHQIRSVSPRAAGGQLPAPAAPEQAGGPGLLPSR